MTTYPIKTLFLDIGGVLLTNGWDRHIRRKSAETFGLDYDEMDERHNLTFDTYEEGKLSLDEYLKRVVFYTDRTFTQEDFKAFMFEQSRPMPEMIDLISRLKKRFRFKTAAVSNEGRELTGYRIKKFGLDRFIDFFISSCFVHFRKPDADIYRIALDCAQVVPEEALYIDDRAMFVEVARSLGIRGLLHVSFAETRTKLASFGFSLEPEEID